MNLTMKMYIAVYGFRCRVSGVSMLITLRKQDAFSFCQTICLLLGSARLRLSNDRCPLNLQD